jgi:hypothetical protein
MYWRNRILTVPDHFYLGKVVFAGFPYCEVQVELGIKKYLENMETLHLSSNWFYNPLVTMFCTNENSNILLVVLHCPYVLHIYELECFYA